MDYVFEHIMEFKFVILKNIRYLVGSGLEKEINDKNISTRVIG